MKADKKIQIAILFIIAAIVVAFLSSCNNKSRLTQAKLEAEYWHTKFVEAQQQAIRAQTIAATAQKAGFEAQSQAKAAQEQSKRILAQNEELYAIVEQYKQYLIDQNRRIKKALGEN